MIYVIQNVKLRKKHKMPRVSKEEKQRSRDRILDAASKLTREKGIDASSVADIMNFAGLTHGGFYRHFASKDELVASGFRHAVDEAVAAIEQELPGEQRRVAKQTYIDRYLSLEHLQAHTDGCPIAALASEIIRKDGRTKSEGSDAVKRVSTLLDDQVGSVSGEVVLAMLVGSITLARLLEANEEAETLLEATRFAIETLQKAP